MGAGWLMSWSTIVGSVAYAHWICRPRTAVTRSVHRRGNLVLCGPSGTGKTFLFEALGQHAVEQGLRVAWFTLEGLGVLLRRHRAETTVTKAWAAGALTSDEIHTVSPVGMVVVEGVDSARPELAAFYDLVVYVDTPSGESMQRLRARGHDHGPIDWKSRWRSAEEHYLAVARPREGADLVVSGTEPPDGSHAAEE